MKVVLLVASIAHRTLQQPLRADQADACLLVLSRLCKLRTLVNGGERYDTRVDVGFGKAPVARQLA
eukprot:1216657-Prymnesium_polylepis.2